MTLVARQSTLRRCGLLLPGFVSRQLVYTGPVFAASVSKADDCPVFKTVIKPLKVFIVLFVNQTQTGVGPVNRVGLDYRDILLVGDWLLKVKLEANLLSFTLQEIVYSRLLWVKV